MQATTISSGVAALELLEKTFTNLLDDQVPDYTDLPMFVAIDTEAGRDKLYEVGFSTFDPYCLLLPDDSDSLNDRIATYYYARYASKNRHRQKPYRLGTAQKLDINNLRQIFDTHLQPKRDGRLRKIILVGHYIISDLRFLERNCHLHLSRQSNVEAILDTQTLSYLILEKSTQFISLKSILEDFELNYIGLHNAGHDSRYTLRALLMLFVRSKQSNRVDQSEPMRNLTTLMENIARCHKVNERRIWSVSTKVKSTAVPALFDQDVDEDEAGMLSLLV